MKVFLSLFLLLLGISFAKDLIVVSTYPLYYPVKNIVKDSYRVDVLIKTSGDPHHYELNPDDMRRLSQASLLITLGVEPWERKLMGYAKRTLEARNWVFLEKAYGQTDPHFWLSPKRTIAYVQGLKGDFVDENKKRQYLKKLYALDHEYRKGLSSCKFNLLVSTHLSLGYLKDYGISSVGIAGLHAEEEPRPKDLARLIDLIKEKGLRYILVEKGFSSDAVNKIAKEARVEVLYINTSMLPEGNKDYIDFMLENLQTLRRALECR
ncbi:metal ABC transporter substrate-binding protein [Thermocrinis minervae]|uniref:Zinc transport system substrate-binding protein n=1 Tax=Thermocrinis minervae TaxID=381751 RepID=A0A1M6S1Y8_9AQUI|nr:metal ABC transporter substrate-binding protein [Thermocrinis minervae]SHK38854.1 zinc transport system substrate-binding protein [Thermocrinis minervae]